MLENSSGASEAFSPTGALVPSGAASATGTPLVVRNLFRLQPGGRRSQANRFTNWAS